MINCARAKSLLKFDKVKLKDKVKLEDKVNWQRQSFGNVIERKQDGSDLLPSFYTLAVPPLGKHSLPVSRTMSTPCFMHDSSSSEPSERHVHQMTAEASIMGKRGRTTGKTRGGRMLGKKRSIADGAEDGEI